MAKARIKREKDFENGSVAFTEIESGNKVAVSIEDICPGATKALQRKDVENGSIALSLLVHALNAKVGDSAADPETDAIAQMQATIDQLKAGEWSSRGEGTGGPRVTRLAEAIARLKGKTVEEVVEKLNDMSDDEKKSLRQNAKVKEMMATIAAERAAEKAAKADGDDTSLDDF